MESIESINGSTIVIFIIFVALVAGLAMNQWAAFKERGAESESDMCGEATAVEQEES